MGKVRGIGMAVGSAAGAAGVARQLQKAQRSGDRLLLVNALASGVVVVTPTPSAASRTPGSARPAWGCPDRCR